MKVLRPLLRVGNILVVSAIIQLLGGWNVITIGGCQQHLDMLMSLSLFMRSDTSASPPKHFDIMCVSAVKSRLLYGDPNELMRDAVAQQL